MGTKLGIECKMYYGSAGATNGTNVIDHVRENDLTLESSEVDETDRSAEGWEMIRQGLSRWAADFDIVYNTADTAWVALKNAFLNKTIIGFSILDGAGGEGINGKASIVNFSRGEPLDGVVVTNVRMRGYGKPTWGSNS